MTDNQGPPRLKPDQKRMLTLDGGGVMGAISLQFLKEIERQLKDHTKTGDAFRLCDYFDYIGGTSTGAIIASGLAIGMSVDELIEFYDESAQQMFQRAPLLRRLWYGYDDSPLARQLKAVIGSETIGEMQQSGRLKSLLLVVVRNVTTDSPWPITTNPDARFNDASLSDSNLNLPLWQLVRASTAAPTFFRPEVIDIGDRTFQFVDGGVTPYNNPSFLMYKLATEPQYRLRWPSGSEHLMLVSVGTGLAYAPVEKLSIHGRTVAGVATTVGSELMRGMSVENDINCRSVGRCVHGLEVDSELGDMIDIDQTDPRPKAFTYARYDADLSERSLIDIGLADIQRQGLRLDAVQRIADMKRIGQAFAKRDVKLAEQFTDFLPTAQ